MTQEEQTKVAKLLSINFAYALMQPKDKLSKKLFEAITKSYLVDLKNAMEKADDTYVKFLELLN